VNPGAGLVSASVPRGGDEVTRRGAELLLLVLATVVVTVALVVTDADQNRRPSIQLL
jgi:hypothetical protein